MALSEGSPLGTRGRQCLKRDGDAGRVHHLACSHLAAAGSAGRAPGGVAAVARNGELASGPQHHDVVRLRKLDANSVADLGATKDLAEFVQGEGKAGVRPGSPATRRLPCGPVLVRRASGTVTGGDPQAVPHRRAEGPGRDRRRGRSDRTGLSRVSDKVAARYGRAASLIGREYAVRCGRRNVPIRYVWLPLPCITRCHRRSYA
jgi:hypothetical protein